MLKTTTDFSGKADANSKTDIKSTEGVKVAHQQKTRHVYGNLIKCEARYFGKAILLHTKFVLKRINGI